MAREIITFQCTECKRKNYTNTKNKKTTTERLELNKFCPSAASTSRTRKSSKMVSRSAEVLVGHPPTDRGIG